MGEVLGYCVMVGDVVVMLDGCVYDWVVGVFVVV